MQLSQTSVLCRKQAKRAGQIIHDLGDFERPSPKARLNLNEVVERAVFLSGNELKSRGIDVDLHLPPLAIYIEGNENLLLLVCMNMIRNAAEAMEEDGDKLLIEAVTTAQETGLERAVVRFVDNGRGIRKEHLPFIFEPGWTTKPQGMGRGLPICQRIVQEHGGKIEVESREGGGSTFTVILPCVEASSGQES